MHPFAQQPAADANEEPPIEIQVVNYIDSVDVILKDGVIWILTVLSALLSIVNRFFRAAFNVIVGLCMILGKDEYEPPFEEFPNNLPEDLPPQNIEPVYEEEVALIRQRPKCFIPDLSMIVERDEPPSEELSNNLLEGTPQQNIEPVYEEEVAAVRPRPKRSNSGGRGDSAERSSYFETNAVDGRLVRRLRNGKIYGQVPLTAIFKNNRYLSFEVSAKEVKVYILRFQM